MATGNQTQITPPRVPLTDERTGAVSREWYRWFYSLFTTLGSGTGVVPVTSGGTGLSTIPSNGQLLIGNGTGYSLNTLGTSAGISVTNGLGTIVVANTGVLSNLAGTGISVSSATGNVTVANTGVLSWSGGTTGLTPATATTGAVTLAGTLAIANGGTNGTATPTAYGVTYGTGTAYAFTAAGTTGQVLTATTGGAPTWAAPATSGTVTSVAQSFTGGLISVAGSPITSSGTLALTVAGTSGGIPYFSSATTWATSAALAANALVIGGGAGAAPATTATGTGVVTALGVNTGTAGAFVVNGGALGTPSSGTVTNLTGTASININGTVGATTPAAGSFTTLGATGNVTLGDASADTVTVNGRTTFNASPVISVTDNTNAALRITQLGTGNALLVEDSANPDSTPVVIDASGNVAIGSTTATERLNLVSDGRNFLQLTRASTDSTQSVVSFRKARGTNAAPTIAANGDAIGDIQYYGYDGTQFIQAAGVQASVDGTPGANDMPGRLTFSTTADGASTPTERMRIDSAGAVGINGAATAGTTFQLAKNITGSTVAWNIYNLGTIQSDVTSQAKLYVTNPSTAAAAFTLANLTHYFAQQGTIGATSTVTNQFGFEANNTLIGATNNYGFYSNIAAGTNRFNFYAAGTATNFFAGNTIISVTDNTNAALRITQLGTGNALLVEDSTNPDASPFVVDASGNVLVNATSAVAGFSGITSPLQINNGGGIAATFNRFSADGNDASVQFLKSRNATYGSQTIVQSGDNLGTIRFAASDGTAFLQAATIAAVVDGTPGVNDMPGRLVFSTTADGASSPTERMRIDSAGRVGIGGTPAVAQTLVIGKNLTGAATAYSTISQPQIQSDVTSNAYTFYSGTFTAATAFTLSNAYGFAATQASIGAGSTVTNQFGFAATSSLTGATNNYGFHSNIAAGTNRFNFYAAGTAANLFAGVSQFAAGTAALPSITQISDLNTGIFFPAADTIAFTEGGAEAMRIDSSGNVGIGNTAANVNDQVGAVRPLLVSKSDSATTIAGSQAAIVIGNSDTTTSNTSQLSFAAITGGSTTFFTSAAINCIFGARTNAQYPTGILTFSTSTSLNSAPTEKMRIANDGIVTMSAYGAGAATFSAAGVISSVSDETWKIKDGVPADVDSMLKKLEPGYWYYNDEKKQTFGVDRQLGFYAQNVNAAIGPEAAPIPETVISKAQDGTDIVTTKPWGYYDRSVLAVTVMSLQKALATIEALTARIAVLEAK